MNSTVQIGNCTYHNELQPMYNAIRCPERNCFSMWKVNELANFDLLNKGCWKEDCESNLVRNILFCCCNGEFCNRNTDPEYCFDQVREQLNLSRILKILKKSVFAILPVIKSNYLIILAFLVFLVLMIVLILNLRSIFKKNKLIIIKQLGYSLFRRANYYDEERLMKDDSDLIEKDTLKLANGSHADIYKGRLIRKDRKAFDIAIKIFRSENEFFFKNEFQIYNLPNFKHDNILEFMKAKKVSVGDFWLITKYQEQSSLLNFLKKNQLNLNQLIQICLDISTGLNYLHGQNKDKRSIAHLDIKPANILLNSNLNACLADFELSKVFHNSKQLFDESLKSLENSIKTTNNLKCKKKSKFNAKMNRDFKANSNIMQFSSQSLSIQNPHQNSIELPLTQINYEYSTAVQQIGTIRYSSPEILCGIKTQKMPKTFADQYIDSLLKSDVYSCSLVYWEMLNRLELNGSKQLIGSQEYRTVFENCKNDEELFECVVNRKERPVIDKRLRINCLLNSLCKTIEDCWSPDPKARYSASRLYENLKSIHNSSNKSN